MINLSFLIPTQAKIGEQMPSDKNGGSFCFEELGANKQGNLRFRTSNSDFNHSSHSYLVDSETGKVLLHKYNKINNAFESEFWTDTDGDGDIDKYGFWQVDPFNQSNRTCTIYGENGLEETIFEENLGDNFRTTYQYYDTSGTITNQETVTEYSNGWIVTEKDTDGDGILETYFNRADE